MPESDDPYAHIAPKDLTRSLAAVDALMDTCIASELALGMPEELTTFHFLLHTLNRANAGMGDPDNFMRMLESGVRLATGGKLVVAILPATSGEQVH